MPQPPLSDEDLDISVATYVRCNYSTSEAASVLGLSPRAMRHRLKTAREKGKMVPSGVIQEPPPLGFSVKGTSTLVGGDGEIKAQWVKTEADKEQREEQFRAFAEELADIVKGKVKPTKEPKSTEADLLTVYPMGDPHIGMYAWADEAGEDFDLDIAERDLTAAMARLVQSAPKSETALILNLGDFFHADNMENRTMRSGNVLDVDTRWQKVLQVGARAFYTLVQSALKKHRDVVIRNVIGNHDDHSAVFLSLLLDAYYRNEPRVTVELSPSAVWYMRFGKVLIGATHGDKAKWKDLAKIMAVDRPDDWGQSVYRYWHTGHVHHDRVQEDMGVVMECHRTLAAKDAWHAAQGYRSGRAMKCIVYDREYGEVERHTADIRRVRDGS